MPSFLYRSSASRSLPSCSWEVLQELSSDHLPILSIIPLFPVFHPNERPLSFNFQKAIWDDFAFDFDSRCPYTEEYPSISLSTSPALFTSLTSNAAKSFIPFGHIKRQPQAWCSAEVEEAVSERCKAFAAANASDKDRQAYISAPQQKARET